jgi:hypothetical protein
MRQHSGVIPEASVTGAAGSRHVCGVISPCSANRANKVTPIWSSRQTSELHPLIVRRWVKEGMIAAVKVGQESRIPITESDSGITTTRTGLLKLLALVQDEQVAEVVVTCSDRLARFGVDLLTTLFEGYGTTLTILSPDEDKTPEEELTEDVLAIIASVGRLSGLRSRKRKELLECAEAVLHKA